MSIIGQGPGEADDDPSTLEIQPRGWFVRGREGLGIGCGFDCSGQPLPLFNTQGSNSGVRTSPIHTSKDTSQRMPPSRLGNGLSVLNPIHAHKVYCRSLGNVRSDHKITWLVPNNRENLSPVGERFSRLVVRGRFFTKHSNPPPQKTLKMSPPPHLIARIGELELQEICRHD